MSTHQGINTKISISTDLEADLGNILGVSGAKNFIVHRRVIVNLTSTMIRCSSPTTAVLTTDEFSKYDEIVRQIVKDGMIVSVDLWEMDGAAVEVVGEQEEYYDFEEEDLEEIKESLGMK
jgi:hypothetical protein